MDKLPLGSDPEYPFLTPQEIIDHADAALAAADLASSTSWPVTLWAEDENARRLAAYTAWRAEPVEVEGGPLVIGEWYDVTIAREGYSRSPAKSTTWRVCRYLGRTRSRYYGQVEETLAFGRWGAKAATDKWAHESHDTIAPKKVLSVTSIAPSAAVLAKVALDVERRGL